MNKSLVRAAIGAGIVGSLVLGLAVFINNQANFSKKYVRDQLVEHKITFAPVERLKPQQKVIPCLVENAGKRLTTGAQAECYAKYQVGIDMLGIDNGKGYSEVRYAAYQLKIKAAEAVANRPDDPATAALVKQSAEQTRKGDDILAGEAVKGMLLTAFGFSRLGELGAQAASVSFAAGYALLGTMLVLLVVARRKGRTTTVPASVEIADGRFVPAGV